MSLEIFARSSLSQFCLLYTDLFTGEPIQPTELEALMWGRMCAKDAGISKTGFKIPYDNIKRAKVTLPYMPYDINYTGCAAIKKNGGLYTPCCGKIAEDTYYCKSCSVDKDGEAKELQFGDIESREFNVENEQFAPITFAEWMKAQKTSLPEVYAKLRDAGIALEIPAAELMCRELPKRRKGRPAKSDDSVVDEDSVPKGKAKAKSPAASDDDAPKAKAKAKVKAESESESEIEAPKKGKTKAKAVASEDEAPKSKAKKASPAASEDEKPAKKAPKAAPKAKASKAESDDEKPAKKASKAKSAAGDEKPAKKASKAKSASEDETPTKASKKAAPKAKASNAKSASGDEKPAKKASKGSGSESDTPKKKAKIPEPEPEEEEEEEEEVIEQEIEIMGEDGKMHDYMLRSGKFICDMEDGRILGTVNEDGEPEWSDDA